MTASGAAQSASKSADVYTVSTWRAVAGHRDQLMQALNQSTSGAKVPIGHVVLQHLEGGPWQFLAIDHYNSWQDFATDETASVQAENAASDPWYNLRQYGAWHHDTITDRILPAAAPKATQ